MMITRRRLAAAFLLCQAIPAWAQVPADARVKARLALTLARFTQWPAAVLASPADPVTICLVHRDEDAAEAFAELGGQTVAGHDVRVSLNPDKLPGRCQVLFVHQSIERNAATALAAVAGSPVLTVGDVEGFSSRGGMVELVNVSDTIKLDVNLKALRAAQIGLSSQVLKLARQVRE